MSRKISWKYRTNELANMVRNIFEFYSLKMTITGDGDSLEAWMYHFGLYERGFTVKGMLAFLKKHACIEQADKNLIKLYPERFLCLYIDLLRALGDHEYAREYFSRFTVK